MGYGKVGDKCYYCKKGTLIVCEGKYGEFVGCDRFPECAGLGEKLPKKKDDVIEVGGPSITKHGSLLETLLGEVEQKKNK